MSVMDVHLGIGLNVNSNHFVSRRPTLFPILTTVPTTSKQVDHQTLSSLKPLPHFPVPRQLRRVPTLPLPYHVLDHRLGYQREPLGPPLHDLFRYLTHGNFWTKALKAFIPLDLVDQQQCMVFKNYRASISQPALDSAMFSMFDDTTIGIPLNSVP